MGVNMSGACCAAESKVTECDFRPEGLTASTSSRRRSSRSTFAVITQKERLILRKSWDALGPEGQVLFIVEAFAKILNESKQIRKAFGMKNAMNAEELRSSSIIFAHVTRVNRFLTDLVTLLSENPTDPDDGAATRLCRKKGTAHLRVENLAWGRENFQVFVTAFCESMKEETRFARNEERILCENAWAKMMNAVVTEMRNALFKAQSRNPSFAL